MQASISNTRPRLRLVGAEKARLGQFSKAQPSYNDLFPRWHDGAHGAEDVPMRTRATRFLQVLLLAPLVIAAGWVLSGGVLAQGPPGQRATDRVNGRDAVAGEVIVKFLTPKTTAELAQTDAIIAATKDDDLGGNGRLRHIRSDRFDA